jgi:hypothetical protein
MLMTVTSWTSSDTAPYDKFYLYMLEHAGTYVRKDGIDRVSGKTNI